MARTDTSAAERSSADESAVAHSSFLAVLLAWLIPGAGHFYLGRRLRGISFFGLVMVSFFVGMALEGHMFVMVGDQPLSRLGTLASMGTGLPYFLGRFVFEYQGDIYSQGYEYGKAFLLTAGLMNLLLILDAWDISRGAKV